MHASAQKAPYKIFFETLGNKARWRMVHCMMGNGPIGATAIAKKTGLEQSLVSHHLRRLLRCGFVTVKPNGRERVYTLNRTTIKPLLKLMDSHLEKFCKKCR